MFVTIRESVSYEVAKKKVLNWTSKGRYLDLKRASFASQLGVFKKPKEYVLGLNCMKITYKLHIIKEYVVC